MKLKCILVVILSLLSFDGLAACTSNVCYGIGDEVVKSAYLTGNGSIYLEAGTGRENLECTLASGGYMVLEPSHPLFKEIYATVLAAMSGRKKLNVRVIENTANCRILWVRMWN